MTAPIWSDLQTAAWATLLGLCPSLSRCEDDPRSEALLALLVLSQAQLDAERHDNRLDAELRVVPTPPADSPAMDIVRHIAIVVSDTARRSRKATALNIAGWLDDRGYALLVADLLRAGARESELTSMTEQLCAALTLIQRRVDHLSAQHLHAILTRDAPQAAFLTHGLSSQAEWLLAPELSGDLSRPDILVRRAQALAIYGSLVSTLNQPAITTVIDRGERLAAALGQYVGLTDSELRAFRGARAVRPSIESPDDFAVAARRLKAYSVPRHEWPGSGEPNRPDEWENSPWLRSHNTHLVRPDYLSAKDAGVQDAILALKDDLLRPLVAARLPKVTSNNLALVRFVGDLEFPEKLRTAPEYRAFLGGLHCAIVGSRKPKAFQEAAVLWHRRAASLSALRHEHTAERPGWPALCDPWRSDDGRYEVVALTSASDLVVEGNEMQHCVGGYYDVCRRGDKQILSLRRDGRRVATVEIELEGALDMPTLKVGQFKATGNARPDDDLHDVLRGFLRDVRSQNHPTNAATLARYRRQMRKRSDYAWRSGALPLEHAREAYPLYRPLLPRQSSSSFDDWCVESGLIETIDRALAALASAPATTR